LFNTRSYFKLFFRIKFSDLTTPLVWNITGKKSHSSESDNEYPFSNSHCSKTSAPSEFIDPHSTPGLPLGSHKLTVVQETCGTAVLFFNSALLRLYVLGPDDELAATGFKICTGLRCTCTFRLQVWLAHTAFSDTSRPCLIARMV
jgi:hypothetical protein